MRSNRVRAYGKPRGQPEFFFFFSNFVFEIMNLEKHSEKINLLRGKSKEQEKIFFHKSIRGLN